MGTVDERGTLRCHWYEMLLRGDPTMFPSAVVFHCVYRGLSTKGELGAFHFLVSRFCFVYIMVSAS